MAIRRRAAGIEPSTVTDVVLIHLAAAEAEFWVSPDFSRTAMPQPVPDVLRSVASRFLDEYRDHLQPFETE
ncbi:hypothetical protein B1R94_12825 [Mycolicibacterium litorale]|nr:hypothetical protein B1R94_12825 [Mycolicibacterium litorale]